MAERVDGEAIAVNCKRDFLRTAARGRSRNSHSENNEEEMRAARSRKHKPDS
jgi:hypothetical protein